MSLNIGGSKSKGSSSQISRPAEWVEQASQRGVGYAEDIFNRGPQAYEGPRVAQLSGLEQQGLAMAGRDRTSPWLEKSAGAFGRAEEVGRRSAVDGLDRYMNPYTKNVLDVANRELGRTYDRQLTDLRGTAASRGAFGGSRQAMLEGQAQRNFLEQQGDLYARGRRNRPARALSASERDLSREAAGALAAAGGYGQIGGQFGQLQGQQLQELMGAGGLERGIEQGALDARYGDFLRIQDTEREDLDRYLASIRAGDYTRTGEGTQRSSSTSFGAGLG
jgi:hypothetical protein